MNIADFRRIALSLEGAEESSHMGAADFRVDGRIFATLAHAHKGYGNLMLTPDQQSAFVAELPEIFLPVHGGWGRNGATHVILATATEDVLEGALRTAYKLRLNKNAKSKPRTAKNKSLPTAGSSKQSATPESTRSKKSTKTKRASSKPR
jgi:hypothetical protein